MLVLAAVSVGTGHDAVSVEPVPAAVAASRSLRDCETCPEMVMIPAGAFVMGAASGEEDREHLSDRFRNRSQPQHRVQVKAFLVGKFEVTRREYRIFEQATGRRARGCFHWAGTEFVFDGSRNWRDPGYAQDDSHPVACISWEDARAYVQWLSEKTGRRYRLPSEAEWEYAARGGTAYSRFWGESADASCAFANGADASTQTRVQGATDWPSAACDDGYPHTAPVGRFLPNPFGLHDVLGNVAEWTEDCWHHDYTGAPVDGHPRADGECFLRVVRGGAWDDAPVGLRAAYRVGSPVVIRVYSRGFRVARDL